MVVDGIKSKRIVCVARKLVQRMSLPDKREVHFAYSMAQGSNGACCYIDIKGRRC